MSRVKFPVTEGEGEESLNQLIKDCQSAVFGYKGENVLDETYRKAAKMDSSCFSSDFCPYTLGIVDTIAQVLLPNVSEAIGTKGVRAELYKLNASVPSWTSPPVYLTIRPGILSPFRFLQSTRRHSAFRDTIWVARRLPSLLSRGRRVDRKAR